MRFFPALAAFAALTLVASASHAAQVQITVVDPDGKPVPDVVVVIEPTARPTVKAPAGPALIEQRDLKFVPFLTVVQVGSTVRFVNRDGYDHHIKAVPSGPLGAIAPVKTFELRLSGTEGDNGKPVKASLTMAEVKFDAPGAVGLGCHLHSSMRGQMYVSPTPWFAKTDANGVATIADVPDGAAEASLWHPDQLSEQPSLKLQVTSAPLTQKSTLNFTPRRRRT